MSLATQLSVPGLLTAWGLSILIWAAAVAVGRLLLSRAGVAGSTLSTIAIAGPWGLAFMVSVPAVFISSGTTMLAVVPLVQLALAAFYFFRPLPDRPDHPKRVGNREIHPRWTAIAIFFAVVVLCVQALHIANIMPYRGAGQWQMPFEDYTWFGMLAQHVARDGVESWSITSIPTPSELGQPLLHWYHWLEFWLAGLVSRMFRLNAFLVLLFVAYPVLLGMVGACSLALLSHFVRWTRASWLLGALPLVLSAYVDLTRWTSALPAFEWIFDSVHFTNYVAAPLYVLCGMLLLVTGRHLLASSSIAFAFLLAPPLAPVVVPALFLIAVVECVLRLAGRERTNALIIAGQGISLISIGYLWLRFSRHELGPWHPVEVDLTPQAILASQPWLALAGYSITNLGGAAVVGLPYIVGLYVLWHTRRSSLDPGSTALAVLMTLCCLLVCFPVLGLLLGASGTSGGTDAPDMLSVMWMSFLVPLGWVGLCKVLVEGAHKTLAAFVVTFLATVGISDLARTGQVSAETFSADQAKDLTETCRGHTIGYFSPESTRDREWWESVESGWAVLSECRFVRLNRTKLDELGISALFWRASAPAMYAHKRGIPWTNTAPVILGFAHESGITLIAESAQHPIPAELRPSLDPWRPGGPFMLYRLKRE